jgi:hypothetical protein
MARYRWRLIAIAALALVVVGCPKLEFTDASLVPGSLADGAFTLEATLEVRYEPETCETGDDGVPVDEDCMPEPETTAGHGLIGVWLPEGWQVAEVRLRLDRTGEPRALAPFDYIEPGFPDTFPHAPGKWWPFATDCEEAHSGSQIHTLEIDVSGPTGAEELTVGLITRGVWSSHLTNPEATIKLDLAPQIDARVSLAAGTVEVRRPAQTAVPVDPAAAKGLDKCVPVEDPPQQVEPGPRGCSCRAAGRDRPAEGGLLGLLVPALTR